MKKILLLLFVLWHSYLFSQSSGPSIIGSKRINKATIISSDPLTRFIFDNVLPDSLKNEYPQDPPSINLKQSVSKWGLYGIGNLNTEALKNLNASGKLSGFFRPYRGTGSYTTINFSWNKNASNNDSLLVSTFLFPDVGNNSFSLSLEHSLLLNKKNIDEGFHIFSPFLEFSLKNINGRKDDSTKSFTSLNYVIGGKYTYWFRNGDDNIFFTASPFFAINHVPEKFSQGYKYLFESDNLTNNIKSLGIKFSFQYNNVQFFSDLRHVLGSKEKIPVEQLRGFNYNIGVVFNAELIER